MVYGPGVRIDVAEGQNAISNSYGGNNEKTHRGAVCRIGREVGFVIRRLRSYNTPFGIGETFSPPKT